MPPEQSQPKTSRTPTGIREDVFDSWKFKTVVDQDVPSHIVKQLQEECGNDLAQAIEKFRALENEAKARSQMQITEEQVKILSEENAVEVDSHGRKDIVVRDQYWDKSKRDWVLKKARPSRAKKYDRCILFVRRVYSEKMIYIKTVVVVRGAVLRNALRNIFRGASGFTLTNDVESELSPRFMFWALPELRLLAKHYDSKHDAQAIFEINAALKFIDSEYSASTLANVLPNPPRYIMFDTLWTIFPPDSLVVGQDSFSSVSIWLARSAEYRYLQDGSAFFEIQAEYLEWGGKTFGNVKKSLTIPYFDGVINLEDLSFCPLRRHSQRAHIEQRILKRSEKKFEFCKPDYKIQQYEGLGLIQERGNILRHTFQGRIIIDPLMMTETEPESKLYPELSKLRRVSRVWISDLKVEEKEEEILKELLQDYDEAVASMAGGLDENDSDDSLSEPDIGRRFGGGPSRRPRPGAPRMPPIPGRVRSFKSHSQVKIGESASDQQQFIQKQLSKEEKMILSSFMYGFSLKDAKWGTFSIDRVSEVVWDSTIFDSLVMDPRLKKTIFDLIKAQSAGSSAFDDFVKGKGRGLIGLLFGPPGSGKTLTAEAIAETAKMPLYVISSGALGYHPMDIFETLREVLQLAAHWKAVLLLDEADVFLAKRTLKDSGRNAIVSIFLRELEYYQGILLLTTNKADLIDEAFQSRIHFTHRYPNVDAAARRQIWTNFMDRARVSDDITIDIGPEGIAALAEKDLNGRQIKNIASMAVKMASIGSRTITADSILATADLLQKFNFSSADDESDINQLT